jgi:hypothetical protein
MSNEARYGKWSDEKGHSASALTASVAANTNYPVTNIQTAHPDEIYLSGANISSGVRFVWDHGSAVDIQMMSIHMHNAPAGTVLQIDRNSSNSWPGAMPTTHTVQTYPNPGLPATIALDLTAVTGYSSLRYSSLFVPALSQLFGIGTVGWWSTKREDITNVLYPAKSIETHPKRVFSTAYAQNRREYRLGVRHARQPVVFRFGTAAQWAAFHSLFRSCQDGTNAFFWWRDTTDVGDSMLARISEEDLERDLANRRVSEVSLTMEQIAMGVAIPTA